MEVQVTQSHTPHSLRVWISMGHGPDRGLGLGLGGWALGQGGWGPGALGKLGIVGCIHFSYPDEIRKQTKAEACLMPPNKTSHPIYLRSDTSMRCSAVLLAMRCHEWAYLMPTVTAPDRQARALNNVTRAELLLGIHVALTCRCAPCLS